MLFKVLDSTMSALGAVFTLVAPTLRSVTQPAVIKLEIEYRQYEEKISEMDRSSDSTGRIKAASTRSFVDPALVQSLCILGKTSRISTFEEAVDLKVKEWLDRRLAALPADLTGRVCSIADSAHYEQCPTDPAGAALSSVLKRDGRPGQRQSFRDRARQGRLRITDF